MHKTLGASHGAIYILPSNPKTPPDSYLSLDRCTRPWEHHMVQYIFCHPIPKHLQIRICLWIDAQDLGSITWCNIYFAIQSQNTSRFVFVSGSMHKTLGASHGAIYILPSNPKTPPDSY